MTQQSDRAVPNVWDRLLDVPPSWWLREFEVQAALAPVPLAMESAIFELVALQHQQGELSPAAMLPFWGYDPPVRWPRIFSHPDAVLYAISYCQAVMMVKDRDDTKRNNELMLLRLETLLESTRQTLGTVREAFAQQAGVDVDVLERQTDDLDRVGKLLRYMLASYTAQVTELEAQLEQLRERTERQNGELDRMVLTTASFVYTNELRTKRPPWMSWRIAKYWWAVRRGWILSEGDLAIIRRAIDYNMSLTPYYGAGGTE